MCVYMCIDMCVGMCIDISLDMCIGAHCSSPRMRKRQLGGGRRGPLIDVCIKRRNLGQPCRRLADVMFLLVPGACGLPVAMPGQRTDPPLSYTEQPHRKDGNFALLL